MSATAHPRVSVSAISTFKLSLTEDFAFWKRHAIHSVGISVAKLEAYGWREGTELIRALVNNGELAVSNLIGLGPFALEEPQRWERQRDRLVRAVDAAAEFGAQCLVFTTGPAGPLSWDAAAEALAEAIAPVLHEASMRRVTFAIEHTNSLRVDVGFVHTLADAIDLARRLGSDVCMEINACWAERGLAHTITTGIDRLALVQVSDYAVGTLSTPDRRVPGDGDIPLAAIVRTLLDAGYTGHFDIEIIGPAIEAEGYDAAVPRAIAAVSALL